MPAKKIKPGSTVANKKAAAKTASKKAAPKKAPATATGAPGTVSIRMYCIGTGDCFVLKFFNADGKPFTMMIDCGSCRGDKEWFEEYVRDIATYTGNKIDLLVITHEHTDHVNGFAKWPEIFKGIDIAEAWFAWTENPADPGGAAELLKKRTEMKIALAMAVSEVKKRKANLAQALASHPLKTELLASQESFIRGLHSLAGVNLATTNDADPASDFSIAGAPFAITGDPLPGMKTIKDILQEKGTKIKYLSPGKTVTLDQLNGIRFHVLGPPRSRELIFKEGRQGSDVYKKNMALNESALAAKAFSSLGSTALQQPEDLPFTNDCTVDAKTQKNQKPGNNQTEFSAEKNMIDRYNSTGKYADKTKDESWRKIDDEWLLSAGSLAIRLNSHINNTSLALAVESVKSGKVLLLPGDAEYGNWESWHLIEKWKKKGKDEKHFAEDLLSRTVFYKVGHHLSYNGTALQKGISMMPANDMVAMATLDLERISEGWTSTMPNTHLLQDLMQRTDGRFFIMNEKGITKTAPGAMPPPLPDKKVYEEKRRTDDKAYLYKQYTLAF